MEKYGQTRNANKTKKRKRPQHRRVDNMLAPKTHPLQPPTGWVLAGLGLVELDFIWLTYMMAQPRGRATTNRSGPVGGPPPSCRPTTPYSGRRRFLEQGT